MLYTRVLKVGCIGADVADLQRRLFHLHFRCVGTADGSFGARTALAVRRLQDAYGLTQDGVVGPATMTKLDPANGQVSAHLNIFHDVLYSRGNGDLILRGELIYRLERLRTALGGKSIICNSVYRDVVYNRAVGGVSNSQHLYGRAADIVVVGVSPWRVAQAARSVGFTYIQVYNTFTHVDIR
jgi:hypothetical protein